MNEKANILIADAQFLTGEALIQTLAKRYFVTGRVFTKSELKQRFEKDETDLLIIDPAQFDLDSWNDLPDLNQKILVITNVISKKEVNELNRLGIRNIILKTADEEEIFQAVESALKGKKYYCQEILDMLLNQTTGEKISEPLSLTNTEKEIVKLIAQGLTTKEIARLKFISFHTVMTHRKNIFRKLKVNSVSELIMYSIKAGWIDNIEYYI